MDAGTATKLASTEAEFAEGVAADTALESLPDLDAELEAALRKILLSVPAATAATVAVVSTAGASSAAGGSTLAGTGSGVPGDTTSIAAILTAAGIGPVPAPVPPFSPMLTPAQRIAFNAWLSTQKTIPPKPTNSSDLAYQIAVAGPQEYVLPTGTAPGPGSTLAVDGARPSDGALIEAKNVRQVGCTPRTLNGIQSANFATGIIMPNDINEMAKYAQVLSNPANSQARYLELDTNDPQAVGYWQFLAAQQGVQTDVRYVP